MKKGWEKKKFENCLEKIVYTKKIKKKEFLENGKYPVISQEQEFINGYWNNANDLFEVRTPVVIFGDHTKILKYVDFNFVLGADGVKILKPKKEIEPIYFYYYLLNVNLDSLGYSRHYRLLKEIEINYPKSIKEQKRIVKIVDEVFASMQKVKTNIEQNLNNTKELFESYLNEIFSKKGKDWEEKKLGDVCEVIAGQSPEGKYYNNIGLGLPFYQGKKEFSIKYIGSPKVWTTKITKIAIKDDILLSVRAPVGPINFATQKICIGRGLAVIRASKKIDKDFLFNFLLRNKNLIEGNIGAVFNSINKTQIQQISIPIPPLPEQKRIVKKLDFLSAKIKKLENIYQQKLENLEELKKSILQKAFEGEL